MTKEEAIEIIESRNFYCIECIDRSEECCDALDMAIESLSAEQTAEGEIDIDLIKNYAEFKIMQKLK